MLCSPETDDVDEELSIALLSKEDKKWLAMQVEDIHKMKDSVMKNLDHESEEFEEAIGKLVGEERIEDKKFWKRRFKHAPP